MIRTLATSYGDLEDVRKYRRALESFLRAGMSQRQAEAKARRVGDPGIGWADNDVADLNVPWVALPYEHWQEKWKLKKFAHRKKVRVMIGGKTHVCILGDTMPHLANIKNGAGIDLAPGAQKLFGLKPPFKVKAAWEWVD